MKNDRVGKCSQCKKDSAWNTPAIYQGELWCNRCADDDRQDRMFHSIKQHLKDGEVEYTGGVVYNGIVVWVNCSAAWADGGGTAIPITDSEKTMTPELFAIAMDELYNHQHRFRCTSCHVTINDADAGGRPLFAGKVCKPCWEKHKEFLADEVKKGHVCRMCNRPYGDCCC